MAVKWTPAQQDAIQCREGTVLVSAAAGSGKTAVLVQRVIEILTDREHPVDANAVLVVTFSNAAAAEMKQRILRRLNELIRQDPGDAYLLRQRTLLGASHISTVHSFCLDLVRTNFHLLDLAADFRLGSEKEVELLEEEEALALIEERYESREEGFSQLVELVSSSRDDSALVRLLLTLYRFIRSHPFYDRWLDSKLMMYDPDIPVAQTVWGQVILDYARGSVACAWDLLQNACDRMSGDEAMEKAYLPAIESDLAQLERIRQVLETGSWDDICQELGAVTFQRLGTLRGYDDAERKAQVQQLRSAAQDILTSLRQRQFCAGAADFAEDIRQLRPKIETLFSLVREFDRRLLAQKRRRHMVDFSDLEHFAVQLLAQSTADGWEKTPLAQQLSQSFAYVLVDEYQDTNETQDLIFQSVSRPDNLFMVGDVKQSIYRFRQAMPEIFIRKRNTYHPFDGQHFPARLVLSHNFRSRSQVTDTVNDLFSALMSREVGEIDYDESESLVPAASYPEHPAADTQMILLENADEESSDALAEASFVAQKIQSLLDEGFPVTEDGALRPIRPGDICILLRSPKNKAELYVKALTQRGIPVCTDARSGFLETVEVSTVLSLLRAVDNPLVDIYLTAALMSPVFGFTADEMAQIRVQDRSRHLYLNCRQLAEEDTPLGRHCRQALEWLDQLRLLGSTCPASLLIRRLTELTGLEQICAAMKYGDARLANLRLLADYAAQYEAGGYRGVAGFLRFIDRMTQRGDDLPSAGTANDSSAVRVMSIHRSKGLEFPVVFLCDTAKKFNVQDLRANMLLHSQLGFACVARDYATRSQYTTIPMEALRLELDRAMLSEEMRVLYVALTRAREKLILTSVQNSLEKKLASLHGALTPRGTVSPYLVRSGHSYADWMLMALIHHPACREFCAANGCYVEQTLLGARANIRLETARWEGEGTHQETDTLPHADPAPEITERLRRRMAWQYPDPAASRLPSKLSVSQVAAGPQQEPDWFSREPQFGKRAGGTQLTPAQRGTALHTFLRCARHADASAGPDCLETEIHRLVQQQFLTAAEGKSLDRRAILRYYQSELFSRAESSDWVRREYPFLMELGGEELSALLPEIGSHRVTVQGIADLVFAQGEGLVLADFKTDRVQDPQQLADRYRAQLALYAKMIRRQTGRPVIEALLYSFALGQEVPVELEEKV